MTTRRRKQAENPLFGPPPAEVPLRDAPLVKVIAQVRFPLIASIEKAAFIGGFQEAIRGRYPFLQQAQAQHLLVGADAVQHARGPILWRFHDEANSWRVSLAPSFLALETTRYESRVDLLERLAEIVAALHEHVDPGFVERLGLRYIDHVVGDSVVAELPELVRPEVAGVVATPLAAATRVALSEHAFELPDERGEATVRWGIVPGGSTVDPAALPPVEHPSWVLDIDAFVARQQPFEPEPVMAQAKSLAERVYSIFRWVVTDGFLRRYGGDA